MAALIIWNSNFASVAKREKRKDAKKRETRKNELKVYSIYTLSYLYLTVNKLLCAMRMHDSLAVTCLTRSRWNKDCPPPDSRSLTHSLIVAIQAVSSTTDLTSPPAAFTTTVILEIRDSAKRSIKVGGNPSCAR